MTEMIVVDQQERFDQLSDGVRMFCAERCHELLKALSPYVNGDFNEINPGHVTAYMAVLRELAKLYQASSRPVFRAPVQEGIALDQVELMIESAVMAAVLRAREDAAVAERAAVLRELSASGDEARDRVRMQLGR